MIINKINRDFFLFILFCLFTFLTPVTLGADNLRSFNEIFPGFREDWKRETFSAEGLVRTLDKNVAPEIIPARNSGIDIHSAVMRSKPSFITESLLVVPYTGSIPGKLEAYNALSKIRDLKGRLYPSTTRQANVALFEEATRIESPKKTTAIPDPPPARELPLSETVYIRLKDTNFGNSYYQGNFSATTHGVTYYLTNFRNITYLLFTVMKAETFSAVLYMEPLTEGMLIYSMAGADASNFVSNRIDVPSAIGKRLAVFIGWINDGLK